MKKILYILSSTDITHNSLNMVYLTEMLSKSFDITIITDQKGILNKILNNNSSIKKYYFKDFIDGVGLFKRSKINKNINTIIKQEDPDIIHFFCAKSISAFMNIAKRNKIGLILRNIYDEELFFRDRINKNVMKDHLNKNCNYIFFNDEKIRPYLIEFENKVIHIPHYVPPDFIEKISKEIDTHKDGLEKMIPEKDKYFDPRIIEDIYNAH